MPDEIATDLEALSRSLGVTRSAFLSVYLGTRIRRLRDVAECYVDLQPCDADPLRRLRGESGEEVVRLAELVVDAMEEQEYQRRLEEGELHG
ncbi:hypothetical protein [Rubrivirga sp.]|uniref:hypothetical protein n=1 Tax=Rubrivirga sp. TaxID=1885344 RepID=UPI003C749D58